MVGWIVIPMLEDMLSDFDGTQEAFATITRAALAEIRCRDDLKARLRDAAAAIYRAEWQYVSRAGIPRMFLRWLCDDRQPWLYASEPVDWHLPPTVLVGLENLSDRVPAEVAEKRRRETARRERIDRTVAALRGGWPQDEAVAFVSSREEWQAAKMQAGRAAA